jgi:hypothetical protein
VRLPIYLNERDGIYAGRLTAGVASASCTVHHHQHTIRIAAGRRLRNGTVVRLTGAALRLRRASKMPATLVGRMGVGICVCDK